MSAPLTTREAAAYLRMHPDTLRALVKAGQIARTGTEGRHLFLESDLVDWLQRQRVPVRAEEAPAPKRPRQVVAGGTSALTGKPFREVAR